MRNSGAVAQTPAPTPFSSLLLAKPLTVIICRAGIHEDAVPKSRHSKRRRRRNSQLDRACDERVSNGEAGAKSAEIARTTEHGLVEVRRRLAEILPNGSEGEHHPSVQPDKTTCVDFGSHRCAGWRKEEPLHRRSNEDGVVRHQRIDSRVDDDISAD